MSKLIKCLMSKLILISKLIEGLISKLIKCLANRGSNEQANRVSC